jgi:hypothetical protein
MQRLAPDDGDEQRRDWQRASRFVMADLKHAIQSQLPEKLVHGHGIQSSAAGFQAALWRSSIGSRPVQRICCCAAMMRQRCDGDAAQQ